MPAGIDTDSALLRTLSASNIPDLSLVDYKISTTLPRDELPRSASFSPESTTAVPPYDPKKQLYIGVGGDASPKLAEDHKETIGRAEGENVSPGEEPRLERLGRTRSLVARPKSWIQRVKGSPERADSAESDSNVPSGVPSRRALSKPPRDKSRTTSGSFVTFARRSWISSSRSPSPSIGAEAENARAGQNVDTSQAASEKLPSAPRLLPTPQQFDRPILPRSSTSPPKTLSRSESTFQKIKRRPQSVLMNFTTFTSSNSSASSLPGSSLDNRSTPRTSTDKVPPIPSLNTLPKLSTDAPRRRDELWSSFRSLDNDFSKFQSKTWSLKTNVVRAALLPFLRNHASHASNRNLRPEDLDRRVAILNKWWVGILEVLDGRQNQTVSGVDRPVLLDALIAIMMRPEWRTPPSAFAPLSERSPNQSPERGPLRKQKSTESLGSSSNSQFLTDSVYHNVRNLFTQNLLSQMKFVVDKMSLRNAPASLVTFCGKTAAYAFFFVPGVAEILVRLWKLPAETLRRAADQLGLPKRISQADVDEVIATFPPHVQLLGWTGAKSAFSQLQGKPVYPILAGNIPWYGPWIARWRGRDSDLFFVFTKHYHILAEEFLLSTQALSLKARAPGFVLVQAQLLTTLDATFHRQIPTEPLPITFDDVLAGAGASAAALPLPSSNSARLMAENRLIMLLRDFLSEKPSDNEAAQLTFAGSFEKMMQATTRRISLFDHNACFVLCDFVEEALVIFIRFHLSRTTESDLIDWYFWLDVCKKMLDSQNTMSQIRLFSLLYSAWGVVTSDSTRKQVVCLDWLLTEETFGRYFNHWCPMVRAYYMRLLCWRICREYGESTDLDTAIFSTAYARLKSNWAQYLYLRQAAETGRTSLPSTAPCHPAPGRRLLIIRNDEQSPSSNLFFGFDGIMPSQSGTTQLFANKRHSLATVSNSSATESSIPKLTTDASASANKRRWSFMGKMLPSALAVSENSSPPTKGTSPSKTLEEARRETALARKKQGHVKSASTDSETPPSTSTHRAYTFRFSLEWTQHFDRPQNVSAGDSHLVTRERRLFPPRLPVPAHVWLGDQVPDISHDVLPKNPAESGRRSEQAAQSKYVGRALAEWALIVGEYNNFAERRQAEGVPGLKWVEIPTLGVEGFRR